MQGVKSAQTLSGKKNTAQCCVRADPRGVEGAKEFSVEQDRLRSGVWGRWTGKERESWGGGGGDLPCVKVGYLQHRGGHGDSVVARAKQRAREPRATDVKLIHRPELLQNVNRGQRRDRNPAITRVLMDVKS